MSNGCHDDFASRSQQEDQFMLKLRNFLAETSQKLSESTPAEAEEHDNLARSSSSQVLEFGSESEMSDLPPHVERLEAAAASVLSNALDLNSADNLLLLSSPTKNVKLELEPADSTTEATKNDEVVGDNARTIPIKIVQEAAEPAKMEEPAEPRERVIQIQRLHEETSENAAPAESETSNVTSEPVENKNEPEPQAELVNLDSAPTTEPKVHEESPSTIPPSEVDLTASVPEDFYSQLLADASEGTAKIIQEAMTEASSAMASSTTAAAAAQPETPGQDVERKEEVAARLGETGSTKAGSTPHASPNSQQPTDVTVETASESLAANTSSDSLPPPTATPPPSEASEPVFVDVMNGNCTSSAVSYCADDKKSEIPEPVAVPEIPREPQHPEQPKPEEPGEPELVPSSAPEPVAQEDTTAPETAAATAPTIPEKPDGPSKPEQPEPIGDIVEEVFTVRRLILDCPGCEDRSHGHGGHGGHEEHSDEIKIESAKQVESELPIDIPKPSSTEESAPAVAINSESEQSITPTVEPEETFTKSTVSSIHSDPEELISEVKSERVAESGSEELSAKPSIPNQLSVEEDSIGDVSELTVIKINTGANAQPDPVRRDSFSSITSAATREQFKTAIDNIRQGLLGDEYEREKTPVRKMDSPSDLSPNAPPTGFEDPNAYFASLQGQPQSIPSETVARDNASAEGSVDSSGFEKVDHDSDILAEYGQHFANQMQQSTYGQLPDDPDNTSELDQESGFLLVGKSFRKDPNPVHELRPYHTEIDKEDPATRAEMSSPHDDVIEKDYNERYVGDESPKHDHHHHEPHHEEPAHRSPSPPQHDEVAAREAERIVDDAFNAAHKEAHLYDEVPSPENASLHSEEPMRIHDEVDDILQRVHENDDFVPEPPADSPQESGRDTVGRLLGEDSDTEEPDFRAQTPEVEETTFERQGPLTIPEVPEEQEHHHPHHHGFETEPRPPTPPKDISDEEIQPTSVNLGPAPVHHEHYDPSHPHSILKHTGEPWVNFQSVDPRILEIVYWRDPKKSGIALAVTLIAIFVLGKYPILTVLSYSGLAAIVGTLGFRVFKLIEAQVNKTPKENPFQEYLTEDISLPQERVHAQADVFVQHGLCVANKLKKIFLVENIIDTVKFGLILWSLTYVAAWFSGFAIVLLTALGIFTIPKVYETYQEPIDQHLDLIKGHLNNVQTIVEEKLPFLKRQAEPEKKDQ